MKSNVKIQNILADGNWHFVWAWTYSFGRQGTVIMQKANTVSHCYNKCAVQFQETMDIGSWRQSATIFLCICPSLKITVLKNKWLLFRISPKEKYLTLNVLINFVAIFRFTFTQKKIYFKVVQRKACCVENSTWDLQTVSNEWTIRRLWQSHFQIWMCMSLLSLGTFEAEIYRKTQACLEASQTEIQNATNDM